MPDPASLVEEARRQITNDDKSEIGRKTALVTGSVALGAVITSSVFRRLRHLKLQEPQDLSPAVDADIEYMEIMEGRACFYRRDGSGVPIVLLHGINAAASSYEMKPLFVHLTKNTTRPIYALDWIGFGRSDRPPVRYSTSLYVRQLRRFLSEHVHQPADVVALSLACRFTAEIGASLPYLVQRLVLISPVGLSAGKPSTPWRKLSVTLANSVGAFEIFFYRLTRPELLRRFYERQIFRRADVPAELVDYARATAQVIGAHHAPRYFIQGDLLDDDRALPIYLDLRVPTLVVVPEDAANLIQQFDRLGELVNANPEHIEVAQLPSGLLPQWETPYHLFDALDRFLTP